MYGDSDAKQDGIKRQPEIRDNILAFLRLINYKVEYLDTTGTDIDKKDKVDGYLIFDESTPFLGYLKIPVDLKSTNSYTIINSQGVNCLNVTKSRYIIRNIKGSNEFMWVDVHKLRECVNLNPPALLNNKDNDGSKYFWLNTYIDQHREFFGKKVTKYTYEKT